MATRVRHQPPASPPLTEPARRRRRIGVFGWVGIVALVVALALAGNLAWQVFGTGIVTGHEQERLRRELADTREEARRTGRAPTPIPGDAVGILRIPRIGLDMVVVEGASTEALTKGPGHYTDTAFPWQDHGRVAIAGHRTTYARPFWSLDRLEPGDVIVLETAHGTFRYRVTRTEEVLPSDTSVLEQTRRPTLVLTTCTPRFSASRRLIVFAVRS